MLKEMKRIVNICGKGEEVMKVLTKMKKLFRRCGSWIIIIFEICWKFCLLDLAILTRFLRLISFPHRHPCITKKRIGKRRGKLVSITSLCLQKFYGNPTRHDTDFFVKRDFRINIWIGWHETGKTTYNSLEMHRYPCYDWKRVGRHRIFPWIYTIIYSHFFLSSFKQYH